MSDESPLEELDPLTGLYGRQYALGIFERLLASAARANSTVGAIYADIDRMFSYNRAYGMSRGDELIRRIGAALHEAVGGDGITCRYSGDEFLILLPGFTGEGAGRKAEEVLAAVRRVTYPGVVERDEPNCRSVTLGVAAFPENGPDLEAVIRAADEALSRGKEAGRGRVSMA